MPHLTYDDKHLLLDGQPVQIISGSVCYFRIFPQDWADRLAKLAALGANAVEVYVPWNFHEKRHGEWDFSGNADLAKFLQLSKEAGLLVLLRPGPFICAEWSMGGLPWWLLTCEAGEHLRCSHPPFLKAVEAYFRRLAQEVKPFLCCNGGPIVAAQVENEYGYCGTDTVYLERLRDMIKEYFSPELMLFTVDGCFTPETQKLGGVDGALRTASFGSNAAARFSALKEVQPQGPPVCMEFWVGWFSTWAGGCKVERPASNVAKELAEMLALGASVNLFVFAGGTSFGFWAGANLEVGSGRLEPHVTSYDYDGLLTEAGALTDKFHACRRAITAHTGKVPLLPSALSTRPQMLRPRSVSLRQHASLLPNVSAIAACEKSGATPLSIEALGEGLGYAYYNCDSAAGLAALAGLPLKLHGVRDFALVLCDGLPLGTWDRSEAPPELELPAGTQRLEVLVEVTARPNFGPGLREQKGLLGPVSAGMRPQDERQLFGWHSASLPMRAEQLERLDWHDYRVAPGPCFHRGTFDLLPEEVGHAGTWLRLPHFTRGFAAINGFNLGWHRREGPQLSLYVPPALLRSGQNEVIIFELLEQPSTYIALLDDAPVWSSNRRQQLNFQVREIVGFAQQVGLRRLLRLGAAELGPRRLAVLVTALVALLAAMVAWTLAPR